MRDVLQRFHVGGDVLALGSVAARRPADQFAVLVAQRHRQAVDLRLGGKGDLLVVAEPQEAADARDKIDDVLLGEGVVERQHRHRVPDLGEARRRRRADALGQAFERAQLRKARLDRGVALAQPVVCGIGDGRRVFLIIAPVMFGDFRGEPRMLGLGLLFGEILDGSVVLVAAWHDGVSTQPAARIKRSAAARASAVISAPASMRAISSRRRSALSSTTRVATRLPLASASLVMR